MYLNDIKQFYDMTHQLEDAAYDSLNVLRELLKNESKEVSSHFENFKRFNFNYEFDAVDDSYVIFKNSNYSYDDDDTISFTFESLGADTRDEYWISEIDIARNRSAERANRLLAAKLEKEEKKKQKLLKDEAAEKAEYERLMKKFGPTS